MTINRSIADLLRSHATISATSPVTVAQGGTGATTHTANNVLVGAGTSAVTNVAPSTSGNVLTSNGTVWASAAAPGLSGWSENGGNNDLLPGSASAGIYLGVSSATAANLLDDYEEGSWTPVLGGYSGTSGQSYSYQSGKYTKIGRCICITFNIGLSTKGTISGSLIVSGLPFTTSNASGFWDQGVTIGYSNNLNLTADHTLVGRIRIDQPDILWQEIDWQGDDPTPLTTSNVDSGTTYLYCSATYMIQ
jgi:hypothetical protein